MHHLSNLVHFLTELRIFHPKCSLLEWVEILPGHLAMENTRKGSRIHTPTTCTTPFLSHSSFCCKMHKPGGLLSPLTLVLLTSLPHQNGLTDPLQQKFVGENHPATSTPPLTRKSLFLNAGFRKTLFISC